jgi:serine/threonine protein kinase
MAQHVDEAHARSVLEQALAAPPPSRADVIENACAGDHALRTRVLELLALAQAATLGALPTLGFQAAPDTNPFLTPAPTPFMGDSALLAEEALGATLGPYKLLRLIGEGGFGSVWLADQLRPIVRPVALKIIKLGMDTRQVVARFEQERQALAILDHPHIAKVHDAGATPSGRPYFVMELCKGEPIDAFCDRARLGLDQRLALFLQVCSAVQHAHTKGVIHRDIKPSNILVSQGDGAPTV